MTKILAQQPPRRSRVANAVNAANATSVSGVVANNDWQHQLPALPYGYAALEPAIDRQSLKLHHAVHHKFHVTALNQVLERTPSLQKKSAEWLLSNLASIPDEIRAEVKSSAGGHVNHSLFWEAMSPPLLAQAQTSGGSEPIGDLAEAIVEEFGDVDFFKTLFTNTALSLLGSGWVWLVRAQEDGGRLELIATEGDDNPIAQGYYPLLLCDLWEHAYYLQYKNDRGEYLHQWWTLVNWREAERRYAEARNCAAARPTASTMLELAELARILAEPWRHAA